MKRHVIILVLAIVLGSCLDNGSQPIPDESEIPPDESETPDKSEIPGKVGGRILSGSHTVIDSKSNIAIYAHLPLSLYKRRY